MAEKPWRPCAHAGCTALTKEKYCEKHKPPAKTRRRFSATWNYLYHTRWWQEARAEQLLKEPFCRECAGEGRRVRGQVVDHIRPHRGDLALFRDKTNLQTLCLRHHSIKTRQEEREAPLAKKFEEGLVQDHAASRAHKNFPIQH